MERRGFLRAGAAAGLSGLATSGCAGLGAGEGSAGPELPAPDPLQMDLFLGRLDRAMATIAEGDPLADLLSAAKPERPERDAQREQELVRKSLRSLLLVGSFGDLPEPARAHPGMQDRMLRSLDEMDEAVFGMADLLENLTPAERVELRRKLRKDPDMPMRMAEELDRHAAALELPAERRVHLRSMAVQIGGRLRNQAPDALIDEQVGRVRKVAARHGLSEEAQRAIAARATQRTLASMIAQPATPGAAPPGATPPPAGSAPLGAPPPPPAVGGGAPITPPAAPPSASATPGAPPPPPPGAQPQAPAGAQPPAPGAQPPPPYPYPYPPPYDAYAPYLQEKEEEEKKGKSKAGSTVLKVGGILLGVSVGVGILGGVILAAESIAGAFILTAGAVMLLAGLILLIVGAAIRASANDEDDDKK